MLQSSVSSAGSLILQNFMNGFGSQTVAAVTTAYRVDSVVMLPIINLGSEELTDLVVNPVVSNDVAVWPFEPSATGYGQSFAEIPGNPFGGNYEAGMFARRELTWQVSGREDVLTGYWLL